MIRRAAAIAAVAAGVAVLGGCAPQTCVPLGADRAQLAAAGVTHAGKAADGDVWVIHLTPTLWDAAGNRTDGIDFHYGRGGREGSAAAGKVPADLAALADDAVECSAAIR